MPSYSFIETVTPDGLRIDHLLITNEQPRGLVILLPGRGYTCDYPVLYYLRKAAVILNYDVLSVRYGFQVMPQGSGDAFPSDTLAAEVDQVVEQVLQPGYARLIVVGKSLGTPLAVRYAAQAERLILLTPIGTSVQDAGDKPILAVSGSADPSYQPEVVGLVGTNVRWIVLDGLDHSLEMRGDWEASLDALHQVTQACVDFIA
jgi:pimeloyl-ACP methyl ester carboxylesterase